MRSSRRRCAARNLAFVFIAVSCRHSPRPIERAAARLSAIVGPPSARKPLPNGIAHRDLHAHLRSKDGVRITATLNIPLIERQCPHHCDFKPASTRKGSHSAAARLQTCLNPKRQSFRTTTTSNLPQPEKAVIPHHYDFKPASARKGSHSAPVRLQARLSPKRQSFRASATSSAPQPEKAVIPRQCDFKHASARKGSHSALLCQTRRTELSLPVVPSTNVRTARRPATPRPNTRFSRRRCAAPHLVRFSQPSRAHARLALASMQRRG
jgi:hypothetical protein